MKEKKVITEEIEEKFISKVLTFTREEGLTITNIKESMEKAYIYMEENAVLK